MMNLQLFDFKTKSFIESKSNIEKYNYLLLSSLSLNDLIKKENEGTVSNPLDENKNLKTSTFIDFLEILNQKSFYKINSKFGSCFLKINLTEPNLLKNFSSPYLNLENISTYIIVDDKKDILTHSLGKENDKSLSFFDKKMSLTYLRSYQQFNSNLNLKIEKISLKTLYERFSKEDLDLILIPSKNGYGEKLYLSEKSICSINNKSIFLVSFSKKDLKKSLEKYSKTKKQIKIKEFSTNFFLKNKRFEKDNNYFFIASQKTHNKFQNFNDLLNIFYSQDADEIGEFYNLEKGIKKKKFLVSSFQFLEEAPPLLILKFWYKKYKKKLFYKDKKAKKISYLKNYLRKLNKQKSLYREMYEEYSPQELKAQRFSFVSNGKIRLKFFRNEALPITWNRLSIFYKKRVNKKPKKFRSKLIIHQPSKTFIKYFQTSKANYYKEDFQTSYLLDNSGSKWWKYHKFLYFDKKQLEVGEEEEITLKIDDGNNNQRTIATHTNREDLKLKENKDIQWNKDNSPYFNSMESEEKEWIIEVGQDQPTEPTEEEFEQLLDVIK